MNILELCEPLFLKICELNRQQRRESQTQGYLDVRAEISGLFEEMRQDSRSDARLAAQFDKMELPLTFFVDSMIAASKLKFAGQWHQNRLAVEKFNEMAGDDLFFDLLEKDLNNTSEEASERLAVFYVCLGLGFVGALAGQPDELKECMSKVSVRVRPMMDVDIAAKLCPEAYQHVLRDVLIPPQGNRIVFVLVLFVFFVLSFALAYYGMFVAASNDLTGSVQKIIEQAPGGEPPAGDAGTSG